jgi:xylan 1,4-beta-xylosidase
MKLPRRRTLLFPLAVAIAACIFPVKLFHASEKDNHRVEQAMLERIPHADLGNGYFRNPILVGPGADNTVLKVGSDYYMMAGGGGWPDQLIWHSRDLVNWAPVVRAFHKFEARVMASDLTYYKGKYYIYTTENDPSRGSKARTNIVVWADHIEGPWSDPIDIGVYGLFDPGHVVDQQGNRYLYFNKGMMVRLTPDGVKAVSDPEKVYDGWTYPKSWVAECKCVEAPKLIYRNGYYYLAVAEGGTTGPNTAHMSVVARSKSVQGPWENSPYNPLVHTANPDDKWVRQGHGTFVEDDGGNWWFMYTGFENGSNFGKQSMLLPIEWTDDGWPRVRLGVLPTDLMSKPVGENVGHGMPLSDDFTSGSLGIQWIYSPSTKPEEAFKIGDGKLVMKAAGSLSGKDAIPSDATMLGVMPVNHEYEAEVEVTIPETAEAGLLLSPGEGSTLSAGQNRETGSWATVGLRNGKTFNTTDTVEFKGTHLFIRLRNSKYDISESYSMDGKTWIPFDDSTRVTEGRRLFLYAAGTGEVVFRNFKYRGLD